MLNRIGMALGAGLAAALLFVVTVQGTAIAMPLAYLAPLPIMIATLGWGVDAGAIALSSPPRSWRASIEPQSGLIFAATVALPAWALAAFAIAQGRPPARPRPSPTTAPQRASRRRDRDGGRRPRRGDQRGLADRHDRRLRRL